MPVDPQLVTPCGLYCAPCPLYRARTDEALRDELAARWGAPAHLMVCEGCRPSQGSPTPLRGTVCPTYLCAEDRGVTVCHECAEVPCIKLHPLAERADKLPHNFKVYSMMVQRRDGLEAWAAAYPRMWKRYFEGSMDIGRGPRLPDDPS